MIEHSRLCLDPIQAFDNAGLRCAFHASVPRLPDAHPSTRIVRGSCFRRVGLVRATMSSDVNIDFPNKRDDLTVEFHWFLHHLVSAHPLGFYALPVVHAIG
jgi:hypothetical protein